LKFKTVDYEETALCNGVPKHESFPKFFGIYDGGHRKKAFVWEKLKGIPLGQWVVNNHGNVDTLPRIKKWCANLKDGLQRSSIEIPLDITFANFIVSEDEDSLLYVDFETKPMAYSVDDLLRAILDKCGLSRAAEQVDEAIVEQTAAEQVAPEQAVAEQGSL